MPFRVSMIDSEIALGKKPPVILVGHIILTKKGLLSAGMLRSFQDLTSQLMVIHTAVR